MIVLWETMALGMRALNFSSRVAFDETPEGGEEAAEFPEKVFWGTMVARRRIYRWASSSPALSCSPTCLKKPTPTGSRSSLVEGVVRLALFVGYIALIGLIPDIRRVFQYHGAEHMTIHAYEARHAD